MTDSGLCINHLFVWSNIIFLQNSQWITFPTQSSLILYSFCANFLHSLVMKLIVLFLSQHNPHLLFCCVLSILGTYGVVLSSYQERFSFSLQDYLSYLCPSFLGWKFAWFSLEISIQLLLLPILFSAYFCSIDACVVCIVSGRCNQSSSVIVIYGM